MLSDSNGASNMEVNVPGRSIQRLPQIDLLPLETEDATVIVNTEAGNGESFGADNLRHILSTTSKVSKSLVQHQV